MWNKKGVNQRTSTSESFIIDPRSSNWLATWEVVRWNENTKLLVSYLGRSNKTSGKQYYCEQQTTYTGIKLGLKWQTEVIITINCQYFVTSYGLATAYSECFIRRLENNEVEVEMYDKEIL